VTKAGPEEGSEADARARWYERLMSERFVRGWVVSFSELRKVIGGALTAKEVLGCKANTRTKRDVFMTLGECFEPDDKDGLREGREAATSTLRQLLEEGSLDRKREYDYARVLELILNHVAKPMADEIVLANTYHAPHQDPGCWNPYLRKLRMPRLAKLWASENVRFPWKARALAPGWPTWTEFAPTVLPVIAGELKAVKRADLEALARKTLSDDPEETDQVEATRDELWQGLSQLRKWIAKTGKHQSLLLSMDGDQ
jgi:hypothetical protein